MISLYAPPTIWANSTPVPRRTSNRQGTFLLLNKDNVTRQYIDRHMLLQGISVEHKIEVSTMDLLIDFARIGLGIACVIGEFVRDELQKGSLMECSIREPIPPRRIGFAYPRSARPSAAMSAFLARLASESFPEI